MSAQQAEWEDIIFHLQADVQFCQCIRLAEAEFSLTKTRRLRWPEDIVRNGLALLGALVLLGLVVFLFQGWVAQSVHGVRDWVMAQSLGR